MRKPISFFLLIFVLSLAACKPAPNNPTPTPDNNQIATQVSIVLTSMASPTQSPQPQSTSSPVPTLAPTLSPSSTSNPPTPTLQATSTQSPTNTPTAVPSTIPTNTSTLAITPTFSPGDPRVKLGNPTWQDTFKTDLNWPTGADTFTSILIKDNTLSLTALTKTDGWRLSYPNVQNYYLEAVLRSDNCSAGDHYGLIIRVPDKKTANQGYLFGITCDGQYSLRKWDGTKMTNLIKWTASSAINAGQGKINRVGIMAVGDHFGIYVNGSLLAESIDSSYTTGVFGLFVGGTPNLMVTTSAIAYWENP